MGEENDDVLNSVFAAINLAPVDDKSERSSLHKKSITQEETNTDRESLNNNREDNDEVAYEERTSQDHPRLRQLMRSPQHDMLVNELRSQFRNTASANSPEHEDDEPREIHSHEELRRIDDDDSNDEEFANAEKDRHKAHEQHFVEEDVYVQLEQDKAARNDEEMLHYDGGLETTKLELDDDKYGELFQTGRSAEYVDDKTENSSTVSSSTVRTDKTGEDEEELLERNAAILISGGGEYKKPDREDYDSYNNHVLHTSDEITRMKPLDESETESVEEKHSEYRGSISKHSEYRGSISERPIEENKTQEDYSQFLTSASDATQKYIDIKSSDWRTQTEISESSGRSPAKEVDASGAKVQSLKTLFEDSSTQAHLIKPLRTRELKKEKVEPNAAVKHPPPISAAEEENKSTKERFNEEKFQSVRVVKNVRNFVEKFENKNNAKMNFAYSKIKKGKTSQRPSIIEAKKMMESVAEETQQPAISNDEMKMYDSNAIIASSVPVAERLKTFENGAKKVSKGQK